MRLSPFPILLDLVINTLVFVAVISSIVIALLFVQYSKISIIARSSQQPEIDELVETLVAEISKLQGNDL